jgi:tRNA A-37 threonylcarbamoyl transferase component Bud32
MTASEMGPGAVLGERYTLERRLGAGGMAAVWLAEDAALGRRVAVKVIAETLALDERYRQRFEREARAAASVSHPHIVPVYDYGLHADRPFLVMEYVSGGSLADVLRGGRPEVADSVELVHELLGVVPDPVALARELLGALDCVHANGLVHRDVKPANILLDAAGHARLTDFGIARPEDATSLTQTGMVVGTIRYLAPEVVAGAQATAASDLYAAGIVLRELTEWRRSPELTPLIAGLTAASPENRPQSAAAALRLLETGPTRAVAGTAPTRVVPATAPAPSSGRRPPRMTAHTRRVPQHATAGRAPGRRPPVIRRIPPRIALAGGAVLALLVVVVLVSSRGGGSPTPSRTTPAPASAAAPLADQLRSLGQIVDDAAQAPR